MGLKRRFITVDRKSNENIKIKVFMFNALTKFQSAMGALQLTLVGNYQHCIQMSLSYPSVNGTLLVRPA